MRQVGASLDIVGRSTSEVYPTGSAFGEVYTRTPPVLDRMMLPSPARRPAGSDAPHPERGLHAPDDRRWAILLTLLFFAVVALGLVNHEPWRDELQAWMIARDSGSLGELFQNLRYEGHPAGWYLLLFLLSRFTRASAAMQALHLVIATTSAYLLLRWAPLSRWHRGLIVSGYFFAFEYAVVSRSYAVGVLALFAFCALFPFRHRQPVAVFAALAVLASSSIYGVILALAAGSSVVGEAIAGVCWFRQPIRARAMCAGAAIWLASVGAAIALSVPPPDAHFVGEPARVPAGSGRWDAASTVARVSQAFAPLPDPRDPHLWGTWLLGHPGTRSELGLLLALSTLVILAATLMFLRTPLVLCLYAAGTSGLLLFTYAVHAGYLRHGGHLFVLFVACLWLAGHPTPARRLPAWLHAWAGPHTRWARAFVAAVLVVQCAAAAVIYAANLRRPFSNGQHAAGFLREHGLDALPLAGSHSPEVSSVSALLDRPIHHLAAGQTWTFVPWQEAGPDLRLAPDQVGDRVLAFLDVAGPEGVVLLGYPFDAWGTDVIGEPLAAFTGGIERTEQFYIYRVRRVAGATPGGAGGARVPAP